MSDKDITALTEEQLNELEKQFLDAEGEAPQATGGILGKIPGLKDRMFDMFGGLFNSPHGQALWTMSKDVSKEILYQQAGLALQKLMWQVIEKHTLALSKKSSIIHYAFHTTPGKAVNTVIVCNAGALIAFAIADKAEARMDYRAANILRGAGKALVYSAGVGVVDVLNITDIIDTCIEKLVGVTEEIGIDLEKLGESA